MEIVLMTQDIVLIGLFNPSKFDRYTFIKNKILKEDEILDQSLFLPENVNIVTRDFNIIINPNQLIISSLNGYHKKLSEILLKILNVTEILTLNASGFNFRYFIKPIYNESEISEFVKSKFYNPNNPIQSEYFNEDSMFGFYSSKNFKNTRMKLDVKPITINLISQNNQLVQKVTLDKELSKSISVNNKSVQFEFNYHKDYNISENSIGVLKELIENYQTYKSESDKIIKLL